MINSYAIIAVSFLIVVAFAYSMFWLVKSWDTLSAKLHWKIKEYKRGVKND